MGSEVITARLDGVCPTEAPVREPVNMARVIIIIPASVILAGMEDCAIIVSILVGADFK